MAVILYLGWCQSATVISVFSRAYITVLDMWDNCYVNAVCGSKLGEDATLKSEVTESAEVTEQHRVDDLRQDDDVSPTSTKTRLGSSDCRLCRHSCSDRASLQHHLVQVNDAWPSRRILPHKRATNFVHYKKTGFVLDLSHSSFGDP